MRYIRGMISDTLLWWAYRVLPKDSYDAKVVLEFIRVYLVYQTDTGRREYL